MSLITFALSLYVCASLLWHLKKRRYWALLIAPPIVLGAVKLKLLQYMWPGGTFIYPEAPRLVQIAAGWAYVLFVVILLLVLLRDVLLLVIWACSKRLKARIMPHYGLVGLLLFACSVVIASIGCWQSMLVPEVRVESVTLPALPEAQKGFKIAVLADIHATPVDDEKYVAEIVRRTMEQKPDIIVLPGDVSDGDVALRRKQIAPLCKLKAPYGVYASMGNHEYYSGYNEWKAELEAMGIKVLVNESRELAPNFYIAAVGDPSGDKGFPGQSYHTPGVNYVTALKGVRGSVILLAHQPKPTSELELMQRCGRFSEVSGILQISGHTHGGMMWGFADLVIAPFNAGMVAGLYARNECLQVYVSRGAGLWPGFPLRVGVPSEITLIHLH